MERLKHSSHLTMETNMSADKQEHDMQTQMEEAHHHHTAYEFSEMILSLGPNAVLALLNEDAKRELRQSIIIEYNHRLVETTGL